MEMEKGVLYSYGYSTLQLQLGNIVQRPSSSSTESVTLLGHWLVRSVLTLA